MAKNFNIDGADQHALSYIERSEVFLTFARILFSQKMFDSKTRGENAAILSIFTTLIQSECLVYTPTNTFCGLSTIR